MNANTKQARRAGFTLVEIIVVLVILAILAAFTIPAMLGFIADAREKECISIRGTITRGYTAEYVAAYPDGAVIDETAATALALAAVKKSYGDTATLENMCPSGGGYSVVQIENDPARITLKCSKHDSDGMSYAAFDPNTTYQEGDVVIHGDYVYRCFKENNMTNIEKPTGYLYKECWTVIASASSGDLAYNNNCHYATDTIVVYNKKKWKYTGSTPSNGPPPLSSEWVLVNN